MTNAFDAKASGFQDIALSVGRSLVGLLFIIAAYNKLSPKVREALDKVAEQWGPKMTRENTGDEERDLEILKTKHGVTLVRPSKEEIDRLTAKVSPTWDAWAKQHGPRAIEQVKEIREILKR